MPLLICLLISVFLASDALSEEIRLGENRSIKGTIVKTTPEAVFVDVGYTILSIPQKEILEIIKDKKADSVEKKESVKKGLYTQKDLKPLPVLDNVQRIGEGVILVKNPGGLGSGSIINEEGYAITNAHVVQGEQDITITVFTKKEKAYEKRVFKKVKIIAVNPYMDLALLKIDKEEFKDFKFTVIPFGDSDKVKAGEPVFAIGNPIGLERSVSEGIVSTKNRAQEGLTHIQTTAAVNPGNSGGPLFNLKGQMIGVVCSGYLGLESLNFAIPIHRVKEFITNRDAFAFDKDNANSGYHYLTPPPKGKKKETIN